MPTDVPISVKLDPFTWSSDRINSLILSHLLYSEHTRSLTISAAHKLAAGLAQEIMNHFAQAERDAERMEGEA